MTKEFLDFIDYVQTAQRAALTMESVERFDVNLRPGGKCSIWISKRKDRASNSWFYDAVDGYSSPEKLEEIKEKLVEYYL